MPKQRALLVIVEQHASFSEAASSLKHLTAQHGLGALITPSHEGFAILASPAFIERLAGAIKGLGATVSSPTARHLLSERFPIRHDETSWSFPPRPRTESAPEIATLRAKARSEQQAMHGHARSATRFPSTQPVLERARLDRMVADLVYAYRHLPSDSASKWTHDVVRRLGATFARRVSNVVDLSLFVLETIGGEVVDAGTALLRGRGIDYLADRTAALKLSGITTIERTGGVTRQVVAAFRASPGTVGAELMVTALAFFLTSGGFDGDGGVPDLDFELFGVGGHRSIFTHSIVAGTVIETMLYALIELITLGHAQLPMHHDPLWDVMHTRLQALTGSAVQGASAGLAYHLAIDTVLQPGTYKDLPFPAPLEVHQGITGANAASEAKEALCRQPSAAPSLKPNTPNEPKNDARRIARAAVGGAIAVAAWLLGIA